MKVAAALLLLCLCATGAAAYEAGAHWNYNNNGEDWPGTCETGTSQTPINVPTTGLGSKPVEMRSDLTFGTAKGLKVINTGHALQVVWDELVGNTASAPIVGDSIYGLYNMSDGQTYTRVPLLPLQFHVHSTSEHLIDGKIYAAELHLVTKVDNTTGAPVPPECNEGLCLAVFGVMYNMAKDPYAPGAALWDEFLDMAPQAAGAEYAVPLNVTTELNLDALFPADKTYVAYSGSLTTPPCSEGVMWHVFLNSIDNMSAAQLDKLQALTANTIAPAECTATDGEELGECNVPSGARTTNRAIQPINGRNLWLAPQA